MADRTKTRSIVLGTLLVLGVVACGGGDDGAGEQAETPPPTTVAASGTVDDTVPASTAATAEPPAPPSTQVDDVEGSDEAEPLPEEPVSFADHLELGMCFDDTFDDQGDYDYSGEPQVVDCGSPHDNEVVLVNSLDGGADAPYPDDEVWDNYFDDVCDPTIRNFLGIDGQPSTLDAYFLGPDEEEWAAGSRSVPCVVYLPDAKLAGSVEGAGNDIVPAGFPADAPRPEGIELSSTGTIEESYSPSESFVEEAGI
ncbi:MAG: septum formation family protein, partial [Ilumatobacteraceae bacterium]